MKADLHNHLGRNGKNPGFDETIDLVHKRLGGNSAFGICNCSSVDYRFEDFVNQKGGKYSRDWLDDEKNILFVPEKQIYIIGCEEVQPKQGHIVIAGMPSNQKIQKTDKILELEDVLKFADDFKGIKIAVHPFGRDGLTGYLMGNSNLLNQFDGWEVYNATAELAIPGILPFNANKGSNEFYNLYLENNYLIGVCAFTDGHSVGVIGRSYTNLDLKDVSIKSLKDAIKTNSFYNNYNNLHREPAKWDAFKHAVNMVKHKLFNCGA